MRRTSHRGDGGLRALLIAWREYRLPKSPPPPRWSAPAGRPDELLDALKAGEAVELTSVDLLLAYGAAGLSNTRFGLDGADDGKVWLLDERDRLTELPIA